MAGLFSARDRQDNIPENTMAKQPANRLIAITPQNFGVLATQNAHHFQLSADSSDYLLRISWFRN
jgi:hypothetical protein